MIIENQKEQHIFKIIYSSLKDKASMLTKNEKEKLAKFLLKNKSIVSCEPRDTENSKLLIHQIDTSDTSPIRMAPRRIPYLQQEEVQQYIIAKEAAGIVKKSTSLLAFLIVFVRKMDGTVRNFIDYRCFNDVT